MTLIKPYYDQHERGLNVPISPALTSVGREVAGIDCYVRDRKRLITGEGKGTIKDVTKSMIFVSFVISGSMNLEQTLPVSFKDLWESTEVWLPEKLVRFVCEVEHSDAHDPGWERDMSNSLGTPLAFDCFYNPDSVHHQYRLQTPGGACYYYDARWLRMIRADQPSATLSGAPVCGCTTRLLMSRGCMCGAIKAERRA